MEIYMYVVYKYMYLDYCQKIYVFIEFFYFFEK